MIEIELDRNDVRRTERILEQLKKDKVARSIVRAANRAAVHARAKGLQEIRKVYAIKTNEMRKQTLIRKESLGVTMHIRGPVIPIREGSTKGSIQYKGKAKKQGIFVKIKKGGGGLVPRSFAKGGRFFIRISKTRYPIKELYGPSVPQLFGNPDVVDVMQDAGMDMYEKRLEHELSRVMENAYDAI